MSDERDRARLISAYADDLIARRASERPVTEPGPESDLARMLEVTRELTEIEFEMPPGLTTDLLAAVQEEARAKERPREAGALRRSFTAIRALVDVGGVWRLGRPVGACIAIVITVAVFFARRDATLSASELLTESARAEAVRLEPPGLVARRAFTIEARDTADHKLLAAQHVELWVNPKARIKARRLFDDRHRLLGGEWTESDGSRVVYERGKPPRKEHSSEARPTTLDAMWRWEPSAEDFSQLVGNVARVTARKTDTGFELSLVEANARLAHVELSLDGEHLPLAQRVVLREGGHVIEVHTRRTVSEVLPETRVANTSFEPEVELLPPSTTSALSTAPREATAPPAAASLLTEQAMDGLELQAWYRLHQLGRCLAEPGLLQRQPGQLDVRAVLTSAACRTEASRSFAPLAGTPGVSVELLLTDSAIAGAANQTSQPNATAAIPNVTTDLDSDELLVTMPGYRLVYDFEARQVLRDPRGGRDVDAAVKPLIRRLALWARDRSTRRLAWVRELERLSTRWPPTTLKPLGLDAASMWQAMVRDNARMLAEDTDLLVAQLGPALDVSSAADQSAVPALRTLTDVRGAIGELQALVAANDADIRALFTARRQDETGPPVPSGALLIQALRKASRLAVRLTEPWALEP